MAVPAAKLGSVRLVHAGPVPFTLSVDQLQKGSVQSVMLINVELKDHCRKVVSSGKRIAVTHGTQVSSTILLA